MFPTDSLFTTLQNLEEILVQYLVTSNSFSAGVDDIIESLNKVGHILFRLDYDNNFDYHREDWGTNYQDKGANGLEITFIKPSIVHVKWIVSLENK